MRPLREERGQAVVAVVLLMTVLLGVVGIVVDIGAWLRADRAAQATADAAALAGAQALPDEGHAIALASTYATKNGGGVPAGGIKISSSSGGTLDTVKVSVERPVDGVFTKLFGISGATAHASAAARAGQIGAARFVAPIVVNEKHPDLLKFGKPTELEYHHLKTSGPQSNDGAGSFGFINLVLGGGNPGTSQLGEWIEHGLDGYMEPDENYVARTGNPFSSSNLGEKLEERIGTELLFPVYRKLTGTGSNAKYWIIGWVGFHLTGIDLHGSSETLEGYFTEVIWEGIQTSTNPPPNFGVRAIQLVE